MPRIPPPHGSSGPGIPITSTTSAAFGWSSRAVRARRGATRRSRSSASSAIAAARAAERAVAGQQRRDRDHVRAEAEHPGRAPLPESRVSEPRRRRANPGRSERDPAQQQQPPSGECTITGDMCHRVGAALDHAPGARDRLGTLAAGSTGGDRRELKSLVRLAPADVAQRRPVGTRRRPRGRRAPASTCAAARRAADRGRWRKCVERPPGSPRSPRGSPLGPAVRAPRPRLGEPCHPSSRSAPAPRPRRLEGAGEQPLVAGSVGRAVSNA